MKNAGAPVVPLALGIAVKPHPTAVEAGRDRSHAGDRPTSDQKLNIARAEACGALLAIANFLRTPPTGILQEVVNDHIIAAADAYLAVCKEVDES